MSLDIAFSDHFLSKTMLEDLGQVVKTIHSASSDEELCFWTFIRYISVDHSSILSVKLDPEMQTQCDQLLQQVDLPPVGENSPETT